MSNEQNEQEVLQWIRFAKGMNESLADVLRHDEGHDKWHAMHGDSPCTSEADCAKKRAKYDEVKSEVTKGDTPGHEFHGNQYTAGIGDAVKDLSNKLNGRTSNGRRGTPAQMEKAHKAIAEMHREAAKKAPNESSRRAHEKAATAHARAATIQRNPSEHEAVAAGRVYPTLGRQLASADAIDASRATPEGRTTTMTQADIDHFNEAYDQGLI